MTTKTMLAYRIGRHTPLNEAIIRARANRGQVSFWCVATEPRGKDGHPAVCKITTPLTVTVANKNGVWFIEIDGIRQSYLKPSKSLKTALDRAQRHFLKPLEPWRPVGDRRPERGSVYRVWYEKAWAIGEWDGEDWNVWPDGHVADKRLSSTVPPSSVYLGDRIES